MIEFSTNFFKAKWRIQLTSTSGTVIRTETII